MVLILTRKPGELLGFPSPCSLEVGSRSGEATLHCAVRINMPRMIALLVASGAEPTLVDREGLSPLNCAIKLGCHDAELALKGSDWLADSKL